MSWVTKLKKFSILVLCFIVSVFAVKIFEVGVHFGEISCFSGFLYGNIIACGFIAALAFVLYFPISFLSEKVASYVAAALLGIMLFTEVGLIIYQSTTGIMMGKELVIRPLWETIHTIKSAINVWMIIGVVVLLFVYVVVSVWFSKKNIHKGFEYAVILLMIASIPLFFTINTNQDKAVVNKTMYCIRACIQGNEILDGQEINLSKSDYDPAVIDKYLEMFPERKVADKKYPLERKDKIENVLGQYFKKSDAKPNVVVIIVESLGSDLFGINDRGINYTPFLDSLSEHSLLWTNCMATTPRSFGAVPAITGSVPHGLKGFQFGDIPQHNSMLSILADNGYQTNAFYAGNFAFDRIYDYLVEQKIDYMSPLYEAFRQDKSKERDGTYWGYHDDVMFQKSMDIIEKMDNNKPSLDLFITISQHEDLQLYDKEAQKRFYDEAAARGTSANMMGKMAATLYTDNALRRFMQRYNNMDKDGNTIFIITGDHSMNLHPDNPLDAYHVPLIIWSPLLEKTGRFEAMVSHNDITPSIMALMRDNFGVNTPKTVSWVSEGLDMSEGFRSNIRQYILHYSRELRDFIYDGYYYTMDNKEHPLWRVVDGVDVQVYDNQEIASDMADKFKTMVSVDNYVYSNNKLLKHPIIGNDDWEVIEKLELSDSVYCASKPEKPSVSKAVSQMVYSTKLEGGFKEMKLVLTSDIMYTGNVWQDKFISLVVECKGDKMEKVYSSDYMSKYIIERNPTAGKWQKFELTKVLSVNDSDDVELKIYMLPTHKDDMWDPTHTVTLKNVRINLLGLKD